MDIDEIDLAILDLYDYGEDYGVSRVQMHRLLQERITTAYLIASMVEDEQAFDPMANFTVH